MSTPCLSGPKIPSTLKITALAACVIAHAGTAHAVNEPPDPLIGTPSVTVEGKPAARQGDRTGRTIVRDGSTNVFINGRPAATVGSQTECGGTIITGSSSVFINGKPMANGSSIVTPCPK